MAVELNTIKQTANDVMSATQKRIRRAMQNYPEQANLTAIDAKAAQQPALTDAQIAENNRIVGRTSEPPQPTVTDDYVQPNAVDFGAQLTPELASQIMRDGGLPALYAAMNKDSAYEGQDEIDKREKKERQRALVTSIADGLSSIANLGGAMAGGLSQNQASLSEANTKRREYQRQLREKDRDKWQTMMGRAAEMQSNYDLSRAKIEQDRVDSYLRDKYQQQNYELQLLREQRMMTKDARDAQMIEYRIGLLEAQRNKTMSDMESNAIRANAYANSSITRANASVTSAGASVNRANEQKRHNLTTEDQAERGVGKTTTSTSTSPQFMPTLPDTNEPVQPKKKSNTRGTATKSKTTTGSLLPK